MLSSSGMPAVAHGRSGTVAACRRPMEIEVWDADACRRAIGVASNVHKAGHGHAVESEAR